MTGPSNAQLADQIGKNLPFLRRYARALTGQQMTGDNYAMATLETILVNPDAFNRDISPKVALFQTFHTLWSSTGEPVTPAEAESPLEAKVQDRLSKLTPNTREALLLHTIEEFSFDDVAQIMSVTSEEASELVSIAYSEMAKFTTGRVMIIEDESIIAIDLEAMMSDLGHQVTGIARTEEGALKLAEREASDLILSDIQLADDSSGIDAVNKILEKHGDRPVIFITAFPERLLTGEGPEPAFLISKPYTEAQVKSAVSQAMFFSSTETLKA